MTPYLFARDRSALPRATPRAGHAANAASDENVVVECRDCAFREAVRNLGRARVALDDHETATGHEVDWEIRRVAAGVERAGADAGVCGLPNRSTPETPLLDYEDDA